MKKPVIAGIVGPTASGKTALSLLLAEQRPIEIVCMDSMQVYCGLDIGTAKPSLQEQKAIPHHMLDVAQPQDEYSVAQYLSGATQAIDGILARNHLPVLVGGTGLYLRALSEGLTLGHTSKDDEVRSKYENLLELEGKERLHQRLQAVDPPTALRLHPNDSRRVIRALEVYEVTGQPFSMQRPKAEDAPYDIRLVAPSWPRDQLYARVDQRAAQMLDGGLLEEVRGLLDQGVSPDAQSMQGLGYKELIPYLEGRSERSTCEELLKRRTRNYAKRQLTWFRPDARIRWLDHHSLRDQFLSFIREDLPST